MARKKPQSDDAPGDVCAAWWSAAPGAATEPARTAVQRACASVVCVQTLAQLLEASAHCDVLVVHDATDSAALREAVRTVRRQRSGVACVVWLQQATIDVASFCVQMGVADLVIDAAPPRERTDPFVQQLLQRLSIAARRTQQWKARRRQQATRAKALRDTTRQLACVQRELEQQVGQVAGQLAGSFRDMAGQLKFVALASELETLLRQELEVEPLLRTTLEFLLRKVGAVNAAIFLPDDFGDFALGAYVNYDFPRETAQATLEDLGGILAPLFAAKPGLHVIADAGELPPREDPQLGSIPSTPMGWLADSTLGVHTSHSGGACSALLVIFRDKRSPFDAAVLRMLGIMGDLFGQQLIRMVKTTNRASAKSQWDVTGEAA